MKLGLHTVQYCADKLCMSANYFGDLIRKSTGDTASHLIRNHVMRQARNRLTAGETISQVAYGLGFDYPSISAACSRKSSASRRMNMSADNADVSSNPIQSSNVTIL